MWLTLQTGEEIRYHIYTSPQRVGAGTFLLNQAFVRSRNTITTKTFSRLRWHAGLEEAANQTVPSLFDRIRSRTSSDAQVATAAEDVIDTLEVLNHEINGEVPSESTVQSTELPITLVYAMNEILNVLREYRNTRGQERPNFARKVEWSVATAWTAVLDGDIDNIREHLAQEQWGFAE